MRRLIYIVINILLFTDFDQDNFLGRKDLTLTIQSLTRNELSSEEIGFICDKVTTGIILIIGTFQYLANIQWSEISKSTVSILNDVSERIHYQLLSSVHSDICHVFNVSPCYHGYRCLKRLT